MSDDSNKDMAKYITAVVNSNIHDFHAEHLTDAQMEQLNPLIKNAIYTALHSLFKENRTVVDDRFVELNSALIPDDKEEPMLIDEYIELLDNSPTIN